MEKKLFTLAAFHILKWYIFIPASFKCRARQFFKRNNSSLNTTFFKACCGQDKESKSFLIYFYKRLFYFLTNFTP